MKSSDLRLKLIYQKLLIGCIGLNKECIWKMDIRFFCVCAGVIRNLTVHWHMIWSFDHSAAFWDCVLMYINKFMGEKIEWKDVNIKLNYIPQLWNLSVCQDYIRHGGQLK